MKYILLICILALYYGLKTLVYFAHILYLTVKILWHASWKKVNFYPLPGVPEDHYSHKSFFRLPDIINYKYLFDKDD